MLQGCQQLKALAVFFRLPRKGLEISGPHTVKQFFSLFSLKALCYLHHNLQYVVRQAYHNFLICITLVIMWSAFYGYAVRCLALADIMGVLNIKADISLCRVISSFS